MHDIKALTPCGKLLYKLARRLQQGVEWVWLIPLGIFVFLLKCFGIFPGQN